MKNKQQKSFSLIEAITVVFVITTVVVTFYGVFALGTKNILESKKKLSAVALANEKMEIIRNLDYAQIGTTSGIVRGDLPEREVVAKDNGTFYIFTTVQYIDDATDGTLAGDTTGMNDYKKVRVKASWEDDINSQKSVVLVSNFVPRGIETDAGGGTFSINVLDNSMTGIANMKVHIVNAGAGIDTNVVTDNTGNIIFPSVPSGTYSLEVSKDGYFPMQTYVDYPPGDSVAPYGVFDPEFPHPIVFEDQLTTINLYTDKSSDLTIKTQDFFGENIAGVNFGLEGGKEIGDTVEATPRPVYTFNQDLTSDSEGEKKLETLSSGTYVFTPEANVDYEFWKFDLADVGFTENTKFTLSPGVTPEMKAIFVSKNLNSAWITVLDGTINPVSNASVNLKNAAGFDKTLTTDVYGKVYFAEEDPVLASGSYDIKITSDNFQDKNDSISVNKLTKKTVNLVAK